MARKIVLKIDGMHCLSCAMSIDFGLEDLKGIKKARTNYVKQESEIEFDEEIIRLEDIVVSIKKTGYKASQL